MQQMEVRLGQASSRRALGLLPGWRVFGGGQAVDPQPRICRPPMREGDAATRGGEQEGKKALGQTLATNWAEGSAIQVDPRNVVERLFAGAAHGLLVDATFLRPVQARAGDNNRPGRCGIARLLRSQDPK